MERYYVGLDVSKEKTAICVRRSDGSMDKACETRTDPDAIFAALAPFRDGLERVILETGRMANWLYDELTRRGLPAVCVDARQAHAVLGQMHNKTDTNDAAMLADLARTGFYRKVEVKSRQAQERRALLTARDAAISIRTNAENTIRGLLASFGLRVPTQPRTYEGRICAVLEGHDALAPIILPLLAVRTEALRQAAALTKELVRQVKGSDACLRLMTVPGVGTVTAATFVATIDAPERFAKSRSVGAYAGLTSRRYQSGAIDYGGRISKRGDRLLRTILYEAANSLLCRVKPGRGMALKNWATALKQRTSHKKAVVALARKLAVIMHAIWTSGGVFEEREA
ncbi:IS110 family transposase [Salipiger sp. PrR007]|uniref:IS110 family transposase n=1 Tax=Salipiger sp. PrR007 TaxID=2706884 RepID=UPI0013BB4A4A|nr:IS110 family transposase [Salipiger sp. PrR007]NDW31879.1 IS110 family transposase [Salipiger sp. PrR007]